MLRLVTILLLLISGPAFAQGTTGALSQCLADSTTGKDRKDLALWVFFAMASHPEIKQFTSAAAAAAEDEKHKVIAGLYTKLLTDSCLRQFQAAYNEGGATAIQIAFRTLGELAMQELMSNPDVNASLSRVEKHLN